MKLLKPIIKKELEVRSRGYSFPAAIAVIDLILLSASLACSFALVYRMRMTYEILRSSFLDIYVMISMAAYIMLLISAPLYTAASISGERQSGTFDLLLTTSLTPADIVFEKFASAFISVCINASSCLPALIVPLMFGGVGFIDVIILMISFIPGLFLVLAVGMFAGSMTASVTRSTAIAYGMVFALTAGLMIIGMLAGTFAGSAAGSYAWLMSADPVYTVLMMLDIQTGSGDIVAAVPGLSEFAAAGRDRAYAVIASATVQTALGAGMLVAAVINISPGRYITERKKTDL